MSEKIMQLIFWQPGKLQTFKQKMLKIEKLNLLPKWYFENHIDQRILFSFIEARNLSQNWRVKWGGGGRSLGTGNQIWKCISPPHSQITNKLCFRKASAIFRCSQSATKGTVYCETRLALGLVTGQFTKYLFFCLWAASAKKAAEQEVVNLIICGQIW